MAYLLQVTCKMFSSGFRVWLNNAPNIVFEELKYFGRARTRKQEKIGHFVVFSLVPSPIQFFIYFLGYKEAKDYRTVTEATYAVTKRGNKSRGLEPMIV